MIKYQAPNVAGGIWNLVLGIYLGFGMWCLVLGFSAFVQAEEETFTDDEVVVKNEAGHRMLLPKEWPIEHRHGVISPVPIEQYLSQKFDQVRDRFQGTDRRINRLEHRVEALEGDQKILMKRLATLKEQARQPHHEEVSHGDTAQER